MLATHLELPAQATTSHVEKLLKHLGLKRPSCLLVYADASCPIPSLAAALHTCFPDVPVAGCTSFLGVSLPTGFTRGVGLLAFEERDNINAAATLITCNNHTARSAAERAATHLEQLLGGPPDMLLMHATPGCEETLLEGLQSRFPATPVFGGSAADDTVSGDWFVFHGGRATQNGAVFLGFRSPRRISGGFVSGYLPSEHRGVVTRAEGRVIHEIDRKPAAEVYNQWTNGAIATKLGTGGRILTETNLLPLARNVTHSTVMPRRVLVHPESVIAKTGSLALFSRFQVGEEALLMTSTASGLLPRMRRATERAVEGNIRPRGALLVYCGGCLTTTPNEGSAIGEHFRSVAGDVPFIGISTFGEQGNFFSRGPSYHGNLMCSAVVFE